MEGGAAVETRAQRANRLRQEEAERQRIEAQRPRDRSALGSRFQDTCRQTREGGGLPEGSIIPPGITHDLVLQIDLPARRMEREERLLAMRGGRLNSTLYDICREGGGKDARFLLSHGADANQRWERATTLLWRAAEHGHLPVVEALLDAGAGELGNALWMVGQTGHAAIAALLLDRGADVHYAGGAPLFSAVRCGHLETATLLLQRGAAPTNHMLVAAVRGGHHAVAELLRAHGAV